MSDSKTAKKIQVVPCPFFHVDDGRFSLLIDGVHTSEWCGTEAEAQAKARELREWEEKEAYAEESENQKYDKRVDEQRKFAATALVEPAPRPCQFCKSDTCGDQLDGCNCTCHETAAASSPVARPHQPVEDLRPIAGEILRQMQNAGWIEMNKSKPNWEELVDWLAERLAPGLVAVRVDEPAARVEQRETATKVLCEFKRWLDKTITKWTPSGVTSMGAGQLYETLKQVRVELEAIEKRASQRTEGEGQPK